ncbi:hypothetical protein [Saccharopolyspora elongata]|uniref:hypothetical protein n=1 Tax=Saccharopolyspora elongata TaxID=2530387 RepID=UPI00104C6E7F|nr:hypothetical protein [Saccharopolyspora elongata]
MITTPNGPVRLQGESGVAARLVPVTVDDLILAAPWRTGPRKAPPGHRRCTVPDPQQRTRDHVPTE